MDYNVDIVVSNFRNNLKWLSEIKRGINIHVYDKSNYEKIYDNHHVRSIHNQFDTTKHISKDNIKSFNILPNVGCEHQTYLHHIVKNYDNLSDIIIFTQGYPFDHYRSTTHHFIKTIEEGNFYKFNSGYIDILGGFLECDMYGRTAVKENFKLDCQYFKDNFNINYNDNFLFQTNGIFGVTKKCIQKINKDLWSKMNNYIVKQCKNDWICSEVYVMERSWFTLLNGDNILPDIYKPINEHVKGYRRAI